MRLVLNLDVWFPFDCLVFNIFSLTSPTPQATFYGFLDVNVDNFYFQKQLLVLLNPSVPKVYIFISLENVRKPNGNIKCFTMNNIAAFVIFFKSIWKKVFKKSTQKDCLNMRMTRKKLRLRPAEFRIFPVNPWKLDAYVYFQTNIRSSHCS